MDEMNLQKNLNHLLIYLSFKVSSTYDVRLLYTLTFFVSSDIIITKLERILLKLASQNFFCKACNVWSIWVINKFPARDQSAIGKFK